MSSTEISIVYKGEALDEGTMDARELATALQAISKLCEKTHKVINRDKRKISVHVKSDFKSGSFDVGLLIESLPQLLEAMTIILEDVDVSKILEYIGFEEIENSDGISLIGLILFLKGRRPSKTEKNGDFIRVHAENVKMRKGDASMEASSVDIETSSVDVLLAVWEMYRDKPVRDSLVKVLSPLRQDGTDTFEARNKKGKTTAKVGEDQLDYFTYKSEVEFEEVEVEEKVLLQIDTSELTQPSERKFTFSRLERTVEKRKEKFAAIIIDRDYLAKIESGEISFYRGLRIKATIITTHEVVDGRRRTRYEIDDVKHDV